MFRSSHRRYSVKKDVFKKFINFIGKHLCWSQFLINFVNKKLQYKCFPVKFLRISILKNICERLLLHFQYNSHHYFLYRHFHHSQKMHLYLLRILLTTAVDCNMIPSLFKLNFAFFLLVYIFL